MVTWSCVAVRKRAAWCFRCANRRSRLRLPVSLGALLTASRADVVLTAALLSWTAHQSRNFLPKQSSASLASMLCARAVVFLSRLQFPCNPYPDPLCFASGVPERKGAGRHDGQRRLLCFVSPALSAAMLLPARLGRSLLHGFVLSA